jgi:DNA-directed RNA polymerase specialized sigma24 family protein
VLVIGRTDQDQFRGFVERAQPRLLVALTAAYGPEAGHAGTAEALFHGWRHWDRVADMENPVGYLYWVGQSRARRYLIWWTRRACPPLEELGGGNPEPWIEPGLPKALGKLSKRQRVVVVLVCGFGWTQPEVADLLGVGRTTVEQHLSRGLAVLRKELKVAA